MRSYDIFLAIVYVKLGYLMECIARLFTNHESLLDPHEADPNEQILSVSTRSQGLDAESMRSLVAISKRTAIPGEAIWDAGHCVHILGHAGESFGGSVLRAVFFSPSLPSVFSDGFRCNVVQCSSSPGQYPARLDIGSKDTGRNQK